MCHLYRHKQDGRLYVIDVKLFDTTPARVNPNAGLYCYPYNEKGNIMSFTFGNTGEQIHTFFSKDIPEILSTQFELAD